MHRLGTLAVSVALVGSMGLCACGSQQASSQSSSAATSESASQKSEESLKTIGTAQEGGLDLLLTNSLATPIASMSLRESGTEAYGDNLMAAGQTVAAKEPVRLLLDASYASDKNYDLKASMDGGSFFEYKDLPLAKIKELSLCDADGYAYIEYTLEDGSTVSTKAEAEALRDEAKEAAMAAAADTAAMESTEDNSQESTQTYAEPETVAYTETYTEVAEPVVVDEAPAEVVSVETAPVEEAPAQSTDSCLGDDVILRY